MWPLVIPEPANSIKTVTNSYSWANMFIFSIVPIHLSSDSDRIAVNSSNSVDVAEHRVQELEALLSAITLGMYLGKEIPNVSNEFYVGVMAELEKARNTELELLQSTGTIADNDSVLRLKEVSQMKQWVEQRIADLQALINSINQGTALGYTVSGVNNSDLAAVQKELERVIKYQAQLEASEIFWNQVVENRYAVLGTGNDDDNGTGGGNEGTDPGQTTNPWQMDPGTIAMIAASKKRVAELRSMLSTIIPKQTVQDLSSIEEQIKREIENEMYKARTAFANDPQYTENNNPALDRAYELQSDLKAVYNKKSVIVMMSGAEDVINKEIAQQLGMTQFYM